MTTDRLAEIEAREAARHPILSKTSDEFMRREDTRWLVAQVKRLQKQLDLPSEKSDFKNLQSAFRQALEGK